MPPQFLQHELSLIARAHNATCSREIADQSQTVVAARVQTRRPRNLADQSRSVGILHLFLDELDIDLILFLAISLHPRLAAQTGKYEERTDQGTGDTEPTGT